MKYYIKRRPGNNDDIGEVLVDIVAILNITRGVGANILEDGKSASILYEGMDFASQINVYEGVEESYLIFECEKSDPYGLPTIRNSINHERLYIYNPDLGMTLPKSTILRDLSLNILNDQDKIKDVLAKSGLVPIFWIERTYTFYGQQSDGSIHLINPDLLFYFVTTDIYRESNEFSYKVADDLNKFSLMFDLGLVPERFYPYYNKSKKIINNSDIDIWHVNRKIFVKPYIHKFDSDDLRSLTISKDGSALLYMDKIKKGENLNDTLLRILNQELNVSDDYLGAVVYKDLEFDIDKQDNLIPRLVVHVYLENFELSEEQLKQKDRGWI